MARVLHYLDTDTFAGTERHVLILLHGLTRQGMTCALACRTGTEFARQAHSLPGVEIWELPPAPLRTALRQFASCVEQWRPDIIHAHNGRTTIQCAWVRARGRHRPIAIATQHFVDPAHTELRGIRRHAAKLIFGRAHRHLARIIAVSEAVRISALRRDALPSTRIVTIPNGIEFPNVTVEEAKRARRELGIEPECPLVVTIARLSAEKGHRYLLAAIPQILQEFPAARFVWAGNGPLEGALRSDVAQARLTGSVLLPGFRDDALHLLEMASAMVLPSLCEPSGLAIVEAMMLATPVIATDCGGPQEILAPACPFAPPEQAVGWLVPPANSHALGAAVCDVLRNGEQARAVGMRGFDRATTLYTAERMAARTVEVYNTALNSVWRIALS